MLIVKLLHIVQLFSGYVVVMNENPKIIAIIQARMNAERLPGKVLRYIGGIPILKIIVNRIRACKKLHGICVAIPDTNENNPLADYCESLNVFVFRGNEYDVLSRFYSAAIQHNGDIIVRITADNPLVSPAIINDCINELSANGADYVSNNVDPTYPEGLDIEVFTFHALEKAFKEAQLRSEREHVTPYIWKNPLLFKLKNLKYYKNYSHLRWTVDKNEDIVFFNTLLSRSGFNIETVHYKEVFYFLDKHPEISKINSGTIRREGYWKSLQNDAVQ